MLKKSTALLLAVLTMLVALPTTAYAEGSVEFFYGSNGHRKYSGDMFAAVSSSISTETQTTGSFTTESSSRVAASVNSAPNESGERIYKIIEDPNTGETLTLVEPELPTPIYSETSEPSSKPSESVKSVERKVGDTRSIFSSYQTHEKNYSVTLECLYIGTHCTVWGATEENSAIRISETIAKSIGDTFDSYFTQMQQTFSATWNDADNDGKIAIFCYDLKAEYPTSPQTITGGYFWSADFAECKIECEDGTTRTNDNNTDCIHIDTFPLMGTNGNELRSPESSYGTLLHEFQHLLNASYSYTNGSYNGIEHTDTFMDEAFALAAEHMIIGERACSDRVDWFNEHDCASTGLTYWNGSLNNYANSYLFGQYLRTRYGQLGGNSGNTFFKEFLSRKTADYNKKSLDLAAEILSTTSQQLILDFWTAVVRRDASGSFGFAGEKWAYRIQPTFSALSKTDGIYPGGARFYSISNGGCIVKSSANLNFISFPSLEKFKLTTKSSANGSFKLTDANLKEISEAAVGTRVYVSTTPSDGYAPYAVYVDGRRLNGSSFVVTGDHAVSVEFRKWNFHVYWTDGTKMTTFDNGTLRIYHEIASYNNKYSHTGQLYDYADWTKYLDRANAVKVIVVEDEIAAFNTHSLSYFTNATDIILPSLYVTYLDSGILPTTSSLVNVFFDGTEKDWDGLSGDKSQFGDKVRFGIPVDLTVEGLKEAYEVGSTLGSVKCCAVLPDGTTCPLGVDIAISPNLSSVHAEKVEFEFAGLYYSQTVQVFDRHYAGADVTRKSDDTVEVQVQLFKAAKEKNTKHAIVAVYDSGRMVDIRLVEIEEATDGTVSIALEDKESYTIKVLWLMDGFAPVDIPTDIKLP